MKLEDGEGQGTLAGVNDEHRMKTESVNLTELHHVSVQHQKAYIFTTAGFVNITSTGTETGVFYLQNTSATENLFIHSVRTCGNQIQKIIIYKNPTGGTLISTANAGSKQNMNLLSSLTADATAYYGANGLTVTGGSHFSNHINGAGHSIMEMSDALILGRNDSLAITFELASAGDVCVSAIGYYE